MLGFVLDGGDIMMSETDTDSEDMKLKNQRKLNNSIGSVGSGDSTY